MTPVIDLAAPFCSALIGRLQWEQLVEERTRNVKASLSVSFDEHVAANVRQGLLNPRFRVIDGSLIEIR
jgi:hypothetical protein